MHNEGDHGGTTMTSEIHRSRLPDRARPPSCHRPHQHATTDGPRDARLLSRLCARAPPPATPSPPAPPRPPRVTGSTPAKCGTAFLAIRHRRGPMVLWLVGASGRTRGHPHGSSYRAIRSTFASVVPNGRVQRRGEFPQTGQRTEGQPARQVTPKATTTPSRAKQLSNPQIATSGRGGGRSPGPREEDPAGLAR